MKYIALPYSGTKEQIEQRVKVMTEFDAYLMRQGIFTVSPVYKHLMRMFNVDIPGDWAYWGEYSEDLLKRCDELIVLMVDGWLESTGVQAEIVIARKWDVPMSFVEAKETKGGPWEQIGIATIDSLMIEHQLEPASGWDEWGRHQRPVSAERSRDLDKALGIVRK